jgi:hypothetical protein
LDLFRRPIGWGWGELYAPAADGDDRLVGVLEHFGEIHLERFPRPIWLVGDSITVEDDGSTLVFGLTPAPLPEFEEFRDEADPEVTGTLTLSLSETNTIGYDLTVAAETEIELTRLRGPWLRVGSDSFGTDFDDAIFPGIEWLEDGEWSSSNAFIEHPNAERVTPHPNKVTIPTMAVGHAGQAVGLSWDPTSQGADVGRPQPVFACPNSIDRRNDSLLGVMLPGADGALAENDLAADVPVSLEAGECLDLSAQISLTPGSSLDAVTEWVQQNGLPDPPEPRYDYPTFLEWIAECYDTNLWVPDEGFGVDVGHLDGPTADVPSFVERYLEWADADERRRASLEEKVAWCREHQEAEDSLPSLGQPLQTAHGLEGEQARQYGDALLDIQRADGAFTYDPDGRHDNFRLEMLEYSRPLGHAGETELGFCVEGAGALLLLWETTGVERFREAGLETLAFAQRFDKPAGDDWWETPIHGPNLFAGGKAAIAYELGYRATGAEHHRRRAAYWLRSLLPFTHLWEHPDLEMCFNTKPCFVASLWTAISWVNHHVIWEALDIFQLFEELAIDPAAIDPDVDWLTYQRGITHAAMNWVIDSRAGLDQFDFPDERMAAGEFDGLYADVHDPVTGAYAGGPITPDHIAHNVLTILQRGG